MSEDNGNGNGRSALWRTLGVVLGGAAAGLGANVGQSYLQRADGHPPSPVALSAESRVAVLETELRILMARFATYERDIERLSDERERRIRALETRLDQLAGRAR